MSRAVLGALALVVTVVAQEPADGLARTVRDNGGAVLLVQLGVVL